MIWLLTALMGLASADPLNVPETSYRGATILQGDTEVWFNEVTDANYEQCDNCYSHFEGNTLYVGNSDNYGNSVDGIVEFFWFESSIDRGSDFYVAVVKVRATPGRDCPWYFGSSDCELWADDLFDWGEYPVVSVEAITDVSREQGAFRWDWAVPFENYGVDAYGQVSVSNQYGIGANASAGAEGSAMTALSLPDGTNINGVPVGGNAAGSAEIQSKGFLNSDFMVQTQYETTLYEWDVFVNGRADLMAWDTYLNLGERANQSAYYEYFLPIQVEFGHNFYMDQFNFVSNFDTGNINPFAHELGISLQGVEIAPPFYEEPEEEPEPSSEAPEEPVEEPEEEDTAVPEQEDTGHSEELELDGNTPAPIKAGCNSVDKAVWLSLLVIPFVLRRKTQ
tara:strand:+ start:3766 stop:4947 length:1182 start_codon:yes stop_codon:yes gene_type:complete